MGQVFSNDCQEVIPGLFIGHVGCATDVSVLTKRKTTKIVDVSGRECTPPPGMTVLRIPIPDVPWFDIRQIFSQTNAFIHKSLVAGENVLVHCAWGISRSASVVLAYLMAFKQMSLDTSYALLVSKALLVKPNPEHTNFLKLYETELYNHRHSNCQ